MFSSTPGTKVGADDGVEWRLRVDHGREDAVYIGAESDHVDDDAVLKVSLRVPEKSGGRVEEEDEGDDRAEGSKEDTSLDAGSADENGVDESTGCSEENGTVGEGD